MGTPPKDKKARQEALKRMIRDLHKGRSVEEVKKEFQSVLGDADSTEIAELEQALINEGLPEAEIKLLCDVHVAVFEESLNKQTQSAAETNPALEVLRAENASAGEAITALEEAAKRSDWAAARRAFARVRILEEHYRKKENRLFPRLEKHGFTGPTSVMWAIHDDIRAEWKKLAANLEETPPREGLLPELESACRSMRDMIYKEENILFPAALRMLTPPEWEEMLAGEEAASARGKDSNRETIPLSVGALSAEQISLLLTNLPVDVTFVDENDEVRFYSATRERVFERTPDIIGRKVQRCHPPASVARVQRILDDFRAGKRDEAEFWIQMGPEAQGGRFIHIRYFAMRTPQGAYRGALEVTQDATGIRKLTGERRLLAEPE